MQKKKTDDNHSGRWLHDKFEHLDDDERRACPAKRKNEYEVVEDDEDDARAESTATTDGDDKTKSDKIPTSEPDSDVDSDKDSEEGEEAVDAKATGSGSGKTNGGRCKQPPSDWQPKSLLSDHTPVMLEKKPNLSSVAKLQRSVWRHSLPLSPISY